MMTRIDRPRSMLGVHSPLRTCISTWSVTMGLHAVALHLLLEILTMLFAASVHLIGGWHQLMLARAFAPSWRWYS